MLLMEEAERIALEEHGSVKIAVISGVRKFADHNSFSISTMLIYHVSLKDIHNDCSCCSPLSLDLFNFTTRHNSQKREVLWSFIYLNFFFAQVLEQGIITGKLVTSWKDRTW